MTSIHGITHGPVAFTVPAGACDCHTHVFGPATRFAYWNGRAYTPGDASVADLQRLHHQLGIDRVVVVHPSPYGTDNAASLDAIVRLGATARGVAVIDRGTSRSELAAMHRVGMRGARVNLETAGVFDPATAWDAIETTAQQVAPLGWHVQIFAGLAVIAALAGKLATLPVPLVIDHFGRAEARLGIDQPGFDSLLALVASGKAYVKLSAAYRISLRPELDDAAPLARALIAANPDRVLWGSDWPHPGGARRTGHLRDAIEPFQPIDDGAALNRLAVWADNADMTRRILVANPAQLYGFA